MPTPTTELETLRPDLATFEEFDAIRDMEGFVGLQLFPKHTVQVQAGSFGRIPLKYLIASPEGNQTKRAPRSGYSRRDWKFSPDSFATEERGIEEPVDDREAKQYANYFDAEVIARNRAIRTIAEDVERDIYATLVAQLTGAMTNAGTSWSDASAGTPVTDVETAVLAVYARTGIWPDTLALSRKLFRKLRFSNQMIDLAKLQGFQDVRPGMINEAHLSAVFDLPKIVVAGGSKNTANENQTAVVDGIWDKAQAIVCKTSDSPDISSPCIGRTIEWSEEGGVDGVVESYRDPNIRGNVIRVRNDRQIKVMYAELGQRLTGLHA